MSHALYQVTVKLQLMDGDKLLILTTPDSFIDFPGGRIDESEQGLGMEQALEREIIEELGDSVTYQVTDTAFVAHRTYDDLGQMHHVLAVHYHAKLIGGDIRLSDEHATYDWVAPQSLFGKQDLFVSADEYRQFAKYYA